MWRGRFGEREVWGEGGLGTAPAWESELLGLLDYGKKKIIITIILLNIEIKIIEAIIFEFENIMYLSSMSPQNVFFKKRIHKMVKNKMFKFKIISSCTKM